MFLLDETDDDLQIAKALALMNARKDEMEGDRYWAAVLDALMQKEPGN